MRKKGLWNSKKGQLTDIVGAIQRFFGWFIATMPKPVLYLLFLVFLLFFVSLVSFFLNMGGSYCDTAGNEYSTGFFSIFTNVKLMAGMPSNSELEDGFTANDRGVFDSTVVDCGLRIPYYELELPNGTLVDAGNRYYFADTGSCTSCETKGRLISSANPSQYHGVCLDLLVYPIASANMSFYQKLTCAWHGSCKVPEGYVYDGNTNFFVCDSELCEGNSSDPNTLGNLWNLQLLDAGAVLKEPSVFGDRDYRNTVRVECDVGDVHPKLRIFGINFFDYKLWLTLMILSVLVWGIFKIKK